MKKLSFLNIFTLVLIIIIGMSAKAEATLGDTILKIGSTGPDVTELQAKLNYVGFNVGKADGIFGNITENYRSLRSGLVGN